MVKKNIIDSLNPTGSLFVKYNPKKRAKATLSKNIVTLAETMGKPFDKITTIYRGAPKNQMKINPGDFVTTNKQLAKDYAGTGHVISKKVKLKHILDDADDPLGEEYIYYPKKR